MTPENREIAAKQPITEEEWADLVRSCNNRPDLALAARLYFLTNPLPAYAFTRFFPDGFEDGTLPKEVVNYLFKVASFMILLCNEESPSDADWFLAARLIGSLTL